MLTVVLTMAGTLCVLNWLGMLTQPNGGRSGTFFDRVFEENAERGAVVNQISEQTGPHSSRSVSWDTEGVPKQSPFDRLYDELGMNDRSRRRFE